MLRPDSTISCEYDQTFTTDRSSLQKMETTESDASFNRSSTTKWFEGCRRGVFALGPWVLEGNGVDGVKRSTSSETTSRSTPKGIPVECLRVTGKCLRRKCGRTAAVNGAFSPTPYVSCGNRRLLQTRKMTLVMPPWIIPQALE